MRKIIQRREIEMRAKMDRKDERKELTRSYRGDIRSPVGYYSKGLLHDMNGYVNRDQFSHLLKRLNDPFNIPPIKLMGKMKLEEPCAAMGMELFGVNNGCTKCQVPPDFNSHTTGWEMAELYGMCLLRDVKFTDYTTSNKVKEVINSLHTLTGYPKTSPETLFRADTLGDMQGPYVSQFLLADFNMGPQAGNQKIKVSRPEADYLTTRDAMLAAQNGLTIEESLGSLSQPRYLTTLRDGCSWVQADYPTQSAMQAAMVLLKMNTPKNPMSPSRVNPDSSETSFVNFGPVDLFESINRVARMAFLTCWNRKWDFMRIRPEAMSILIDNVMTTGRNPHEIDEEILSTTILKNIKNKQGSYLLSQTHPTGCPTHPAYPSGHSVICGASITVVKAFFDCTGYMPEMIPAIDGQTLIDTGHKLNINDELNKLASNVGTFRCSAGYHYRSDNIEGLKLGEHIAIEFLRIMKKRYALGGGYTLKKRDGSTICI